MSKLHLLYIMSNKLYFDIGANLGNWALANRDNDI